MTRTYRRQRISPPPQPDHPPIRKLRSTRPLPSIPPSPPPTFPDVSPAIENNSPVSTNGIRIVRVPAHTRTLDIITTPLIAAPISENTLQKPSQTLHSMPDIRTYWDPPSRENFSPGWNDRRVIWFFADTADPQSPAYGWYAIFVSWDKGYMPNGNVNFVGQGTSVHKDVFIVKAAFRGKDRQGRTGYVDIPVQFLEQGVFDTVAGRYPTVARVVAREAIEGDEVEVEKRVMREALSG